MKKVEQFAPESFVTKVTNNTGATINAGLPIPYAGGFLIASNDIADGEEGVGYACVEVVLAAESTDDWDDGDPVAWDTTNQELTDSFAGNSFIGFARGAKAATETTAKIFVPIPAFERKNITHHTSGATLTREQSGSVHTNLGAAGAVTLTLPQDAVAGDFYDFIVAAAQELRIDPGAAGAVYILGAKQTDDKYVSANAEAESVRLTADGNGDWLASSVTGTWTVEA